MGPYLSLRVQVPRHEVYTKTIIAIPKTEIVDSLHLGSLDL